jgi:hypothetical protein
MRIIYVISFSLFVITNLFAQKLTAISTLEENVVIPKNHWRFKMQSEGLIIVNDTTTHRYGFADPVGRILIPCIYLLVQDFSEGLAAVMDAKTRKWGYINHQGKVVIPFRYDNAYRFGYFEGGGALGFMGLAYVNIGSTPEGRMRIYNDGKWGLINREGEEIVPIKYGYIAPVFEGFAAVFDGEVLYPETQPCHVFAGKIGFINSMGEIIIPIEYDFDPCYFRGGIVRVSKNGKSFFIDAKGKKVKVTDKQLKHYEELWKKL